jgi:SseB protein N-terminal domain
MTTAGSAGWPALGPGAAADPGTAAGPGSGVTAGPAGPRPGPATGPAGPSPQATMIVIAPAHPAAIGGEQDVVFELRESADGSTVLPVFSSVHALVSALGHAQPWVALPLHEVQVLAAASGVHTILLDPEVAPGAWRWDAGELSYLAAQDGRPTGRD